MLDDPCFALSKNLPMGAASKRKNRGVSVRHLSVLRCLIRRGPSIGIRRSSQLRKIFAHDIKTAAQGGELSLSDGFVQHCFADLADGGQHQARTFPLTLRKAPCRMAGGTAAQTVKRVRGEPDLSRLALRLDKGTQRVASDQYRPVIVQNGEVVAIQLRIVRAETPTVSAASFTV